MLTRIKLTPTAATLSACAFCLLLLSLSSHAGAAAASASAEVQPKPVSLTDIVRQVEAIHFGDKQLGQQTLSEFARSLPVASRFKQRAGVFVTLSRHGKSRACWGNVFPQEPDIAQATVFATIGALTKEYRYAPIQPYEWKQLKPQVTVVRSVEPISSMRMQNPLTDGLLVRSGGKAGVLLPGEAVDAHYQLVQCKLKAGIAPGEPCQLYRLRTEIYE